MKTKLVQFSYPSSDNASRFGFAKLGCYTVETWELPDAPVAIAGYYNKADAMAHAETLPEPWNPMFLSRHS